MARLCFLLVGLWASRNVLVVGAAASTATTSAAASSSSLTTVSTSQPQQPAQPQPQQQVSASSPGNSNPVVQIAKSIKNSVTRTVRGCGELWTNHGRCNDIRTKVKAHRAKIREQWEEQGLFDNNNNNNGGFTNRELNQQLDQIVGGISYTEFAFLQKGKEDRGRILNLVFLMFGAPRFLPYALMFNPQMLPSPLQAPEGTSGSGSSGETIFEKRARERSAEVVGALLRLEKDAREIPALAKLNIFGRKKQEQTLQENAKFNAHALDFLANHMMSDDDASVDGSTSTPFEGARHLLRKLDPYLVRRTTTTTTSSGQQQQQQQDFDRSEKRLSQVPPSIVAGLVNSLTGKGFLSGLSPAFLSRGRLLGHLKRVEEADKFLTNSNVDVSTINHRLLREACSERMIGSPACTIPELQRSLEEWLTLVNLPPTAASESSTPTKHEALLEVGQERLTASTTTTGSAAGGERLIVAPMPKKGNVVYYNENLARVALLSYFALHGVKDSRNRQSALTRTLFSPPLPLSIESSATQGANNNNNNNQQQHHHNNHKPSRFRRNR